LSEFGIVLPQARHRFAAQLPGILEDAENGLPALLRAAFAQQYQWLRTLDERVDHIASDLLAIARWCPSCRRNSVRHHSGIVSVMGRRTQQASRNRPGAAR
jgi:transposase